MMNRPTAIILFFILLFSPPLFATSKFVDIKPLKLTTSTELEEVLKIAVDEQLRGTGTDSIKPEELAATVIDLTDPENLKTADYRGDQKIYPASVVKLFYMVALQQWLEDGKVRTSPELERGLADMIRVSSNDATHYIFDVLTGTSGGPELSPKELRKYAYRKNAVNRYFEKQGFSDINVNQKTYCEDIYGRERQFWDEGKQRNKLTTNSTARLLAQIALGLAVSPERSRRMLELLKRDPFSAAQDEEDQAHGFTGISILELKLESARLFSKAGYTASTRHDAAFIELPGDKKIVIVVFTENHANNRKIIPGIATPVIKFLTGR
ncbi:MAG: serine hydrolase [Pyrinomonadaceae bacterium]